MRDTVELPHGYTLAQAEQLARAAACTVHTGSTETVADKIDHAWSIIVATLYESETLPTPGQLVWAARKSLYREDRDRLKDYGYADRNVANGAASGSSFRTYWYRPSASIEHDLIERHTFAQIWPKLTDRDRQVLVAVAIYDSFQDAAAAIGISRNALHLATAIRPNAPRRRWHAGEPVEALGEEPFYLSEARGRFLRRLQRCPPEGGVVMIYETDEKPQAASRFAHAMEELSDGISRAEKNWEMIAMRLTQFMGEGVPKDEATLKAAPPVATSSAIRGVYDLVDRVRDFSERMARISERLEL